MLIVDHKQTKTVYRRQTFVFKENCDLYNNGAYNKIILIATNQYIKQW